jgi:hypothetical protein
MSQVLYQCTDNNRMRGASFWTADAEPIFNEGLQILSAMAACQTVAQASFQSADLWPGQGSGGVGTSANVLDSAVLIFASQGTTIRLVILGADPAIYLSDGETVNLANPDVANLIATCGANNLSTRTGRTIDACLRGYRISLPAAPVYRY